MSLYQRPGSPFWWFSITVDGRRLRGSTGETDKRRARQVEADAQHEAKHSVVPAERWTINHCFAIYWNDRARDQRSSAATLVKLDALRRLLGHNTAILDLTNADLLDYRAKRRGEGLAAHSVNRDFAYLKAALRHARAMHGQAIPELAWRELRTTEPPARTRFLSHEEYHRLLAQCDPALALIVKVAVATGLRKANLLALDWTEIDLSTSVITVTVKGNKSHTIRMPSAIRAALATRYAETGKPRSGLVFAIRNVRKKWESAVAAAQLHNFRFHDLRHTFASWARMAGADLADICEALGHSSIAVTMRYAHIAPDQHINAFDRISNQVWSQSASHSRSSHDESSGKTGT